jgi:hypothetical protein
VSDTPRADAAWAKSINDAYDNSDSMRDLAYELERELAAMTVERDDLRGMWLSEQDLRIAVSRERDQLRDAQLVRQGYYMTWSVL